MLNYGYKQRYRIDDKGNRYLYIYKTNLNNNIEETLIKRTTTIQVD